MLQRELWTQLTHRTKLESGSVMGFSFSYTDASEVIEKGKIRYNMLYTLLLAVVALSRYLFLSKTSPHSYRPNIISKFNMITQILQ